MKICNFSKLYELLFVKMSRSATSTDLGSYPISGRWIWNENGHYLEFLSNNLGVERQERKRQQKPDNRGSSGRPRRQRSAGTRQGIKQSADHMFVTLQDVKEVAKCMMCEVEWMSPAFDGLYNTSQFDEFLLLLLNYFHWYFVKREESNPNPTHIEQSLAEKKFIAELEVKIELSLKQLARSYGVLILGLGICDEHHMICGRSRTSNTYKDRGQYETMYSFCSFLVWIAFRRREYDVVRKEINRLMRSDTFNPALRAKTFDASDSDNEKKEHILSPAEYRRTLGARPPIKDIINQRSEAMVSILPKPREEASWLFKKKSNKTMLKLLTNSSSSVSTADQLEEQNAQFNMEALQLGIIGESLDLFNPITLSTLDTEEDEKKQTAFREPEVDDGHQQQSTLSDADLTRQTTSTSESAALLQTNN